MEQGVGIVGLDDGASPSADHAQRFMGKAGLVMGGGFGLLVVSHTKFAWVEVLTLDMVFDGAASEC